MPVPDRTTAAATPDAATPADASPPPAPATADPLVSRAVVLGWQMARLHRIGVGMGQPEAAADGKLPGLSALSNGLRTEYGIAEVAAGLVVLKPRLDLAGVALPDTRQLVRVFRTSDRSRVRIAVYRLHVSILGRLLAADTKLGTAYNLGRSLSDICWWEPGTALSANFTPGRVDELARWLDDLASVLPPHSARPVKATLERWPAYAETVDGVPGMQDHAKRAVERQGRIWLSLLSGTRAGTDTLASEDYTRAARALIQRGRTVVEGLARTYAAWVLIAVVVFSAAFAAALALGTLARSIALIATGLATLGVTWKGLGGQLVVLLKELRSPLWGAELDTAIASAIDQGLDVIAASPAREP